MNKLSSGKWVGIIFGGIVFILILWGISAYNNFTRMELDVKTQLAQVEVQYQRRFDLVSNLVQSVRGILKQEQQIFTTLAEARTKYAGSTAGSEERVRAINEIEGGVAAGIGRLLAIVENYPTLKSSENVRDLMTQLEGTENRISTERGRYNEQVNIFNKRVRVFPSNLLARFFGFTDKEFFSATEQAQTVPQVDLEIR